MRIVKVRLRLFWLIKSLLVLPACAAAGSNNAADGDFESCSEIEVRPQSLEKFGLPALEDLDQGRFKPGTVKLENPAFVSAEQVKSLPASADLLWVDIREDKPDAGATIPNSIHIPARDLAGKVFLRNKALLLFDNGFAAARNLDLLGQLQAAGFNNVRVLAGGLNAWRHAGGVVSGDSLIHATLDQVSPAQFYAEREFSDIKLLDFSRQAPDKKSDDDLRRLLRQAVAGPGERQVAAARILLMTDAGLDYDRFRRIADKAGLPPLYFLQGGKQGYRTYLQRQLAVWNRPAEKQGKIVTCGRRRR